jgi:hypothetical protein
VRNDFAKSTTDPMYFRLFENYRSVISESAKLGDAIKVGDPLDVARAITKAAEAESPAHRYLIGRDAEEYVALTPDDFERMITRLMRVAD